MWQQRYARVAERNNQQEFRVQDGCLVLANGQLPALGDITDPVMLGVHGAAVPAEANAAEVATRGAPGYVPRDIDGKLRERVAAGGFVPLVGDSTAGKSRAVFEAINATLSSHLLIYPAGREAIAAAAAQAARERRCVLWLDDPERYLGDGGLTAAQVGRLLPSLHGPAATRPAVRRLRPA